MEKRIKEILNTKKKNNPHITEILNKYIEIATGFDTLPWATTKNLNLNEIFSIIGDFNFMNTLNYPPIKSQTGNDKKNIYIKYNNIPVAYESINNGIEILRFNDALNKYPKLIQNKTLQYVKDKNLNKNDILSISSFENGFFIFVHDNCILDGETIYLYSSIGESDISCFSNNMIIIGEGNNVNIIKESVPIPFEGISINSTHLEIFLEKSSNCKYTNIISEGANINVFNGTNIYIGRDATFEYKDLLLGGRIINQKINTYLFDPNSSFDLSGIAFPNKDQVFETYCLINNISKGTTGKIIYKNVINDRAKLLFDGLIKVDKGADFTNSYLEDHTIILSKAAKSESIPGLEIEANEVKASHGATIGKLDEEQMFYAQSRGLNKEQSKKIIISGFIKPIIDKIDDINIQERMILNFTNKLISNGLE